MLRFEMPKTMKSMNTFFLSWISCI
jgi:hypothetical protein